MTFYMKTIMYIITIINMVYNNDNTYIFIILYSQLGN